MMNVSTAKSGRQWKLILSILVLNMAFLHAAQLTTIIMRSGEILNNTRLLGFTDDSLSISRLDDRERDQLFIPDISTLIFSNEYEVKRIELKSLSPSERTALLNRYLYREPGGRIVEGREQLSPFHKRWLFIFLTVAGLLLMIAAWIIILSRKQRKAEQEAIPGVEQMARTMFFWADYHRGKLHDDD